MNVTGQVVKIGETVNTNNFSRRDVVVKTSEQYPQYITVQFVQDKCNVLDKYQVGQEVTI